MNNEPPYFSIYFLRKQAKQVIPSLHLRLNNLSNESFEGGAKERAEVKRQLQGAIKSFERAFKKDCSR